MIDIAPHDLVACICEGSTEKTVIELLLNADLLCFSRAQLLGQEVLSSVYYKNKGQFQSDFLTLDYEGQKIVILVIQDRPIGYKLPSPYGDKIKEIYSLLTRPEMEMLMVHSLKLKSEYDKCKKKPSVFLQERLKIKSAKLKSKAFVEDFYREHPIADAIKEYKRVTKAVKDHRFLADILK